MSYPNYSGTFVPEIWSTKLAVKFYEASVLAAISSTDYEGEISDQGDKVYIRTVPSITIRDYNKGDSLIYENPESPNVELLIDKAKYFAFTIDDIDAYQSDLKLMDDWSGDAAEQMKMHIDQDVLSGIVADVAAANEGPSAGKVSESYNLGETGNAVALHEGNIIDYIVHLGSVLDEQSVPETGRWIVLPSVLANRVKRSELKDASLSGDSTSMLRNGRMGMIDRFEVYRSNHVPYVNDDQNVGGTADVKKCYHVMAGHKSCLTFAAQMAKVESLQAESSFGQKVRGLNVYGYKVVNDTGLARLFAFAADAP